MLVTGGGAHDHDFTKNDGTLAVTIGTLEIDADNRVDMTINNNSGTATVNYGMLDLQKKAMFSSGNIVDNHYNFNGLRVHTTADWTTDGNWAAAGKTMLFDMTDIRIADQTMLVSKSVGDPAFNGKINLAGYDAVAQHRDYLDGVHNEAFITSAYELKRLNLGDVVLINNTSGSFIMTSREDQAAVDYFGYTSGLRRYYWDIFDSQGGTSLVAHNFATADGYRVYLRGHLAGLANTVQTFWSTTSPLIMDAAYGELEKFTVSIRTGASHIKHDTGSYAEIDNVSAAISGSYKFDTAVGHLTAGLMAEYGHGNYEVSSNIWGLSSFFSKYNLKGKGDTDEFGLVVFARNDFLQGSYIEASLRGGYIDTDFKTKNWAYSGQHRWDNDTNYWSAHLGIGHEAKITTSTMLDIYAKLLWTRTTSTSFTSNFGEHVKLDAVNSLRTRVGGRLNQNLMGEQLKGYIGGAWEHEFDAKAKGDIGDRVIGYDPITDSPDLKSSFMGELGLSYQPAETKISFDAGLFGLAGKQDGYGGYVGVKFSF